MSDPIGAARVDAGVMQDLAHGGGDDAMAEAAKAKLEEAGAKVSLAESAAAFSGRSGTIRGVKTPLRPLNAKWIDQ